MQNLFRRASRLLLYQLIKYRRPPKQLQWLRHYPHILPTDKLLQHWQQSEWTEYQQWIDHHSVGSRKQWLELHRQAKTWKKFPRISIITPVYNTESEILKTCILSVRIQTSPFWELILVDDGSTKQETHMVLKSTICHDPRIRILKSRKNGPAGISAATNLGIEQSLGDYIIFLDHDDRLAPEAVQSVSQELITDPCLDIVYSDRDMISTGDKRFMHLMKPDWSPENLYSGNYIFHLMCYRKELVQKVGNLRSEYDGSQDYDLILRCMEQRPKVKHIPQVLYHWRQHAQSVALDAKTKSYAFEVGIKALEESLKRRKIKGTISEHQSLWRGNYQIHLPPTDKNEIGIIKLDPQSTPQQYVETVLTSRVLQESQPYILIQHGEYTEQSVQTIQLLTSWLKLESVGMVSGCLLNQTGRIAYAGIIYNTSGDPVLPYSGYPAEEPGYMAVTKIARNISGPNPFSVIIRRELWKQLGGFRKEYEGPHALLDLALKALEENWRIVYNPQAIFHCKNNYLKGTFSEQDQALFKKRWYTWFLQGDPCYNPNLSSRSDHYELGSAKKN